MRHRATSTRRMVLAGGAAVLAASGMRQLSAGAAPAADAALEAAFRRFGRAGAFVRLDLATDRLSLADASRAGERFVPASTFKIANTLIALETGVVRDPDEVFRWDGAPRAFASWERDMTLREAVPASNVPVFQEIARRVGVARYDDWLDRLGYGNAQTGGRVDTFWLDGPLRISAIEQAGFLAALALGQLPMSERAQTLTRAMLKVEEKGGRTLFAKTGWLTAATPDIGWWVGWVETGGKPTDTFALNIDMAGADDLPLRIAIGKAMLETLGLY